MTDFFDSADWVHKLHVEFIENEDGSADIRFEWDETDPDLSYWNDLGREGQEKFIMNALENSIKKIEEDKN
jgi:hypothetical protein